MSVSPVRGLALSPSPLSPRAASPSAPALSPGARSQALGHFRGVELPASPRPLTASALAAAARSCSCQLLCGHAAAVRHLAVLPGGVLASAGGDCHISCWELATGLPLPAAPALRGHADAVTCLAALPGGLLASGSRDRTVRVWDPAAGATSPRAVLRGSSGGSAVRSLAALPLPPGSAGWVEGGWSLAVGYEDGALLLWESPLLAAAQPPLTLLPGASAPPLPVALLACLHIGGEPHLLSACGASVQLWGAAGEPMTALTGHAGPVTAALQLADGRLATACAADGCVRVFCLEEGGEPLPALAPSQVLRGHAPCAALHLCPHPSPTTLGLCSAGQEGTLRVWGAVGAYGELGVQCEVGVGRVGQVAGLCVAGRNAVAVAGGGGCALLHVAGFGSREIGGVRGGGEGMASVAAWGGGEEEEGGEGMCCFAVGGEGGAVQSYRVQIQEDL